MFAVAALQDAGKRRAFDIAHQSIGCRALRRVGRHGRGLGVTLFVNWAVKPFSTAPLFDFQGRAVLAQPLAIAMPALPIAIPVFFDVGGACWLSRRLGEPHSLVCPWALIGASNFFELAVATAISLFGFESGAALATVVGVLIEVPLMRGVVRVVDASKPWYESGA